MDPHLSRHRVAHGLVRREEAAREVRLVGEGWGTRAKLAHGGGPWAIREVRVAWLLVRVA